MKLLWCWQIGKECLACREKVAVFNMSYFAKFYLTGPDAQKAVDWIFTNNMAKPPGMCCASLNEAHADQELFSQKYKYLSQGIKWFSCKPGGLGLC